MIEVRPSEARGPADHGWLQSRHSFSFGGYYDPKYMGVSALRVINDDKVAAGAGFATHSHQDMEIISYVKKGRIEHKDSMGNVEQLPPGTRRLPTRSSSCRSGSSLTSWASSPAISKSGLSRYRDCN